MYLSTNTDANATCMNAIHKIQNTHLKIESNFFIGLLHELPHFGAFGIRMFPELPRGFVDLHCCCMVVVQFGSLFLSEIAAGPEEIQI